jgi:hypothetical protein
VDTRLCATCARPTKNGALCVACEVKADKTLDTEHQEHARVAEWLRSCECGLVGWYHPPNDARHSPKQYRRRKNAGCTNGMVDFLVFRPGAASDVALEIKARTSGRVSKDQEQWLQKLAAAGWYTLVAHGSDDAIAQLSALGIG